MPPHLSTNRRSQPPLRVSVTSFALIVCLVFTACITIHHSLLVQEEDYQHPPHETFLPSKRVSSSSLGVVTPTASPSSPEPTVRPDTGAFKSCHESPDAKDAVFYPEFHDGTVVVGCRVIHYKLPRPLQSSRSYVLTEPRQKLKILMGILSAGNSTTKREAVRQTWAKDIVNKYFVVAGPWTPSLETEFSSQQDILWLDQPERYNDLLYKTGAFFAVARRHVWGFSHILKTDDDSYINLPELKEELWKNGEAWERDYFGRCHEKRTIPYRPFQRERLPPYFRKFIVNKTVYPEKWHAPYCQGAGFIVRPSFVECMAQHLPHIRYHPFEDVGIGLLAERCHVNATRHSSANEHKWVFDHRPANLTGKILQHPVETPQDMHLRHRTVIRTLNW